MTTTVTTDTGVNLSNVTRSPFSATLKQPAFASIRETVWFSAEARGKRDVIVHNAIGFPTLKRRGKIVELSNAQIGWAAKNRKSL